jgi:hypothetical protein
MQLMSVVTITIKRTRPHPLATVRLPTVGYANVFLTTSIKIWRLLVGLGGFVCDRLCDRNLWHKPAPTDPFNTHFQLVNYSNSLDTGMVKIS